ncbi:hypothetical protein IWQ60_005480 [Tieghemiomyces parasiticus]|uniref:Uncharacterized protein n=1 Tax=Tieghemiomyces parasiticus TaxID=78921 RepID=A0A9W7ZUD0_9FUNG|nr:hypothetical protein IWQ60_008038 [Tieghemiomyces parasiticus]KAJ1924043.1 hypothetical protein IWQ60_005480 [Tieghemiomyces parasiticus]
MSSRSSISSSGSSTGAQQDISVASYINWKQLHQSIVTEIDAYNAGKYDEKSQRYYHLMALLHSLRSLHLAGLCQPIYIEYCKRLVKRRRPVSSGKAKQQTAQAV